jgi:hypothetical protein
MTGRYPMRLRLVVPFLLILATSLPAALLAGNAQETAKRAGYYIR